MKEIEVTPQACKKEGAIFEGSVKIKIPTAVQRYKYMADINFQNVNGGDIDAITSNQLLAVSKMIELSVPHYAEVNIKYKDGSGSFKSYEDLASDPSCDEILVEVAGMVLNGFKPSKN